MNFLFIIPIILGERIDDPECKYLLVFILGEHIDDPACKYWMFNQSLIISTFMFNLLIENKDKNP